MGLFLMSLFMVLVKNLHDELSKLPNPPPPAPTKPFFGRHYKPPDSFVLPGESVPNGQAQKTIKKRGLDETYLWSSRLWPTTIKLRVHMLVNHLTRKPNRPNFKPPVLPPYYIQPPSDIKMKTWSRPEKNLSKGTYEKTKQSITLRTPATRPKSSIRPLLNGRHKSLKYNK